MASYGSSEFVSKCRRVCGDLFFYFINFVFSNLGWYLHLTFLVQPELMWLQVQQATIPEKSSHRGLL